jgi:pSer/pThr/pTyr-binding forkhead associated (FHA) protein
MITCPNCKHKELPGALYCSECGEQLAFTDKLTFQSNSQDDSDALDLEVSDEEATPIQEIYPGNHFSLYLIEAGKTIPLTGRSEFIVGRVTEGQPILPDIDLTTFEAYTQGVSRLHAAIKVMEKRMVIVDLGSSNGTRVNGQKILANIDYPIKPGDLLALGRLRMQILVSEA